MDQIKELKENEFEQIIVEKGFNRSLLIKDYYLTIILYLIKDIKGLYFKGGTALQKTLLGYTRISEDIDFSINRSLNEVKKEIKKTINDSKIFENITKDKDIDGFTRLIIPYKTNLGKDKIFIDLNMRGKIILEPEKIDMKHFYSNIPKFKFSCLNKKEMVAEKVAAAIGRNKPRDHYDIYQIIKHKIPIDMTLVKIKCKQSNSDPSIIKMFNKAKHLHNKWNEDMLPLITEEISFKEVMQTLSKYFKLKKEKENVKSP